jgi:dolichyl-phosphate-mannose-protein mannosyltransferase
MKKLKVVIISAISLLLLLYTPIIAQSSNLAVNNSFEENEGQNDPYFWMGSSWENAGSLQLDKTQAHSGQSSALIINGTATDSRFKQQIPVKSETYYKLSCWIKTENVGPDAKGANLSIEGLTDTSDDIKGTSNNWTYVELYGISGKDQKSFVLSLGLGGYNSLNTGKAWFDDIMVEELAGAPEQGTVIKLYAETAGTVSGNTEGASGRNPGLLLLVPAVIFLAAAAWFIIKLKKPVKVLKAENTVTSVKVGTQPTLFKLHIDKKDWLIMACMTFVYLIMAVPNLGSLKAPLTSWTPANQGESVIVDLGSEITLGPVYYYGGLGHNRPNAGKYRLQYLESAGAYKPIATLEKNDGNIFVWQYMNSPGIKTRFVKVIADTPGGTLNELVFFEKDSKVPLQGVKIVESNTSPEDEGAVYNLFDETGTVDYSHTYLSGMIFDEIYHARTAYEYLNRMEPYEWTHPPLGKLFISLGILIFGMNPFGWRIIGTLFGAAMVPIMYLFGRKLFSGKFYGFCSAFLILFDFMHFSLSRIATIDVYATFFIILMYYFMVDYFMNKSWQTGFKQSMKPLFLCGLFFGLGAASKWIGLYAGGGLALLFFVAKYLEHRDYSKETAKERTRVHKGMKAPWLDNFIPLFRLKTFIFCIFFAIIPFVIYMLSYIPYMSTPGQDFSVFISNQADMLNYHGKDVLSATHPFSSHFWEWPIMRRPLLTYYGTDLPSGMSSSMTIMGNPAIWWFGILAILASFFIAIRKRDKKMAVVFIAMAFQYLPWFGITRITFIYHFFSSVPFMILCIVYIIKNLLEGSRQQMKYVVYGYLTLVLVLFIMFYPVLSGLEVPRNYVLNYLQWFKSKWTF